MKKSIIKITFRNGGVGYYKSDDCVTPSKELAKSFDKKYSEGLAHGINFLIKVYKDSSIKKAEVEDL